MLEALVPDTTQLAPTGPILFQNLIQSLNQQDYTKIIENANVAIDQVIQSQLLILHDIRAYAYAMAGQFDAAFQDTRQMITYADKYALGYQRMGNLYTMRGRYQDAIQLYDRALHTLANSNNSNKEQQKGVLIKAKEQVMQIINAHQHIDFMKLLPTEITYLIITHLPEGAKLTCLQVSRLWRERTLDCTSAWKDINMRVGSEPEYSDLLQVAPLIGQHVEHLQINFPIIYSYLDALNCLNEGHFNKLKSISMIASANADIDQHVYLLSEALWKLRGTLTNIRFMNSGNNHNTLTLANLLSFSDGITDLSYKTNGSFYDAVKDFSDLKKNAKFKDITLPLKNLEITTSPSIQQHQIMEVVPCFPQLRRLVLFGCKTLNIQALINAIPQLEIFAHDARSRIPGLDELAPISTLVNVNNKNMSEKETSGETEKIKRGLRILYANDGNAPSLSAYTLFPIVHQHMNTIQTIYAKFAPISKKEENDLFSRYPNLKLDNIKRLSFWAYGGIDDWLLGGIRDNTTLHYLSLANVEDLSKVVNVLIKLPTLETLRLSYVRTTMYSAHLIQLLEKYAKQDHSNRQFKYVSLRFCDEITDQVLDALGNIPTLTSVAMQSLANVSTSGVNRFLAKVCDRLTILNVTDMKQFGDDTMRVLGDMKQLNDIYMDGLTNITDEGVRSMMDGMIHPVLAFTIRSCSSVSIEMIRIAKYKLKNPRSSYTTVSQLIIE